MGNCVCAEVEMDHELISVKKRKKKKRSTLMVLDCTEGSNCICT